MASSRAEISALYLPFRAMTVRFGSQMGGHRCGGRHDPVRERPAQILVGLDERLALRGVHQEALRLGRQLDVGRETGLLRRPPRPRL